MNRIFRSTLILLIPALLLLLGCSARYVRPAPDAGFHHLGLSESHVPERYGSALRQMNGEQRGRFYRLQTDQARDQFLQEQMIDVRVRLAGLLHPGMSPAEVRSLLPAPDNRLTRTGRKGIEEEWIYRHHNGYRYTSYVLQFHDNRLVGWVTIPQGSS